MAENLPLLPDKSGAACADVRRVLREVFRPLDALPPLPPTDRPRIATSSSDCADVWRREGELKQKYAQRIAREPLPNIYKLGAADARARPGEALDRGDLVPTVVQNADVDHTLWIRNILTRSSCDLFTSLEATGAKIAAPVSLHSPRDHSLQSLSLGELIPRRAALAPPVPSGAQLAPRARDCILCVPPQLDFVNFTVGRLHTRKLRLVNTSKFEVRLSLRPPASKRLNVEMAGTRGLTVTSGAAAEFHVHFSRPADVRALSDELLVRVSTGAEMHVPIACYMQPPLLDILVPSMTSSVLFASAADEHAGAAPVGDCLELGARLLGDTHYISLRFHCTSEHASFFLITEDAWLSFTLDVVKSRGGVVCAPFVVWPAWWQGGGAVRGCAWCRAREPGLHATALRLVSSTAVVRPLALLADALYFRPEHITIKAQEKEYDICSADDPACQYYVHLGTAFPGRALAAAVHLVNHSPVIYTYYWSVRPWGVCSCWEEECASATPDSAPARAPDTPPTPDNIRNRLCVGALEARDKQTRATSEGGTSPGVTAAEAGAAASRVRVEPARGCLAPRAACGVHVCAPDAGAAPGPQRAVLMLILKNIPKESLPPGSDPMIVRSEVVESDPIPGLEGFTREVCEVVCAQLEVWWEVAPVRFTLDPPLVALRHSRRVAGLTLAVRATQLFGGEGVWAAWSAPPRLPPPPRLLLQPSHSCDAALAYPLPDLPDDFPETDILALEAEGGAWRAECVVARRCDTRHPALRPPRLWLGVVPPGRELRDELELVNDTFQHIYWWADAFRWHGERPPSAACAGRPPCPACREVACTCGLVRPARGALPHGARARLAYTVHAPQCDGCVVSLVRARRTAADVAHVAGGAGAAARAALVAYRVLAPRLHLRVLACTAAHDAQLACSACCTDADGAALLRPAAALVLGGRTCYTLRLANTTPIATAVAWDPPPEESALEVVFVPNEFDVGPYAKVDVQVVVEARRVSRRRLAVRRARVRHAYRPLYLLIDAAVAGLEVALEVPLGGAEETDTTLILRRTQAESSPWAEQPLEQRSPDQIFQEEDTKRALRNENVCRCRTRLVFDGPPRRARPADDPPDIEIVVSPPEPRRECACGGVTAPVLPAHDHPYCLQFHAVPLRTVVWRTLVLRNASPLRAAWRAAVRRCPRAPHTLTLAEDKWAGDVREPGLAVQCAPQAGVLSARGEQPLRVQVYADCWGFYRDQLLVQVERLAPVVLDVWVEARGAPLRPAPAPSPPGPPDPPVYWLSAADPRRELRVRNESRAELLVHADALAEHTRAQNALPFRLYARLSAAPPAPAPACRCVAALSSRSPSYSISDEQDSEVTASAASEEPRVALELYLAPDRGLQHDTCFQVSPESSRVAPGAWATWRVTLRPPAHGELAPPAALVLRALPEPASGEGWHRPKPAALVVRLRQAARAGRLRVSCRELRAVACALDLLPADVLRIRKRFRVRNVGDGALHVTASTTEPWSVAREEARGACGAGCGPRRARARALPLALPPRSCVEMSAEVSLRAPAPPAAPYDEWRRTTTDLHFYDEDNVLATVALVLELEFPKLFIEPDVIDFGFVTDGDTRKSYFSVGHSGRAALEAAAEWRGAGGFRLWPARFTLRPGARERLYLQYTARWGGAPVEGAAVVHAVRGAWCGAEGRARASPARDLARRADAHDHTDDAHLLPDTLAARCGLRR